MKLFRLGALVFGLWSLVTLQACQKMPNGGIPIYIQVDSTSVYITDSKQGSASQKIGDVWASTGAKNLGAYETPVKIPVLAEGDVPMLFSAGIRDNGISNTRVIYPFYQADTFTIGNAIPGHTYFHHPVYRYKQNLEFPIMENFEVGNSFTNVTRVFASNEPTSVFEGNVAGKITIDVNDSSKVGYLSTSVPINAGNQEVYLELNYKSNYPFTVGIVATTGTSSTTVPKISLNKKQEWNKIYINLNYEIGQANADLYSLYFAMQKSIGDSTANLYLDNIKVINYKQ